MVDILSSNKQRQQQYTSTELVDISLSAPKVGYEIAAPLAQFSGETLKAIIENYLLYYAYGDTHTARAKQYDLQHFLEFMAIELKGDKRRVSEVLVSDWTLQVTKNFIEQRLSQGEAPATVSRRLATIKHLGRTLAERVHGYINPAREAKGPVIQPSRPQGLNEEEILLLKEAAELEEEESGYSFLGCRNRFLLELLLATGLRADEVRVLMIGQISEDNCWLRNVKTKGKKFRNVYLDSHIRPLLSDYLKHREDILNEKFPGFFNFQDIDPMRFPVLISFYRAVPSNPSTFGMAAKSIWRVIAAFGRRAQMIAGNDIGALHPHRLRHAFAHGLLDSSKDVRLVAQALGHSDVRITMRYTERSDEQVAEAIEEKIRNS